MRPSPAEPAETSVNRTKPPMKARTEARVSVAPAWASLIMSSTAATVSSPAVNTTPDIRSASLRSRSTAYARPAASSAGTVNDRPRTSRRAREAPLSLKSAIAANPSGTSAST